MRDVEEVGLGGRRMLVSCNVASFSRFQSRGGHHPKRYKEPEHSGSDECSEFDKNNIERANGRKQGSSQCF